MKRFTHHLYAVLSGLSLLLFSTGINAQCGYDWEAHSGLNSNFDHFNGMHAFSKDTALFVGTDGLIVQAVNSSPESWGITKCAGGTKSDLKAVHFTGSSGTAVGEQGAIVRSEDRGKTWEVQNSGVSRHLTDVHFVNSSTGWAVGDTGTVLHTTDGGITWSEQNSGIDKFLHAIHFVNNTTGWIVGSDGTVLYTNDGGSTWQGKNSGTTKTLRGVHFTNPMNGYVVGRNGTVLHTTDGGDTWSAQTSETSVTLMDVHFATDSTGWFIGREETITHTTDGGNNWEPQRWGGSLGFESIHALDTAVAWVGGSEISIERTDDGGGIWSSNITIGPPGYLGGVDFINDSVGMAAGSYGNSVWTYTNGDLWKEGFGSPGEIDEVHLLNDSTAWAIGGFGGTIYFTQDSAYNWTDQDPPASELRDIHFVNGSVGWAVGGGNSSREIIHTTDSGHTWNTKTFDTSGVYWKGVHFVNDSTGWIVGTEGTIIHTTDAGDSWTSQSSDTTETLTSVHFTDPSTGWTVGTNGVILYTNDSGKTWTVQKSMTSSELRSINSSGPSTAVAVGESGTILLTVDSGSHWTQQTSEASSDLNSVDMVNDTTAWAVGNGWTMLSMECRRTSSIDSVSACAPYTWIDGNTYTSDNYSATHTVPNSFGCDSTIHLALNIQKDQESDFVDVCDSSYTWIDGNTYTSDTNGVVDTLENTYGCDSIVTLYLDLIQLDSTVTVTDSTIKANETSANYSWFRCTSDGLEPEYEYGQIFYPPSSGQYAVVLSDDPCSDTSACVNFGPVSVQDPDKKKARFETFPNPNDGSFKVSTSAKVHVVLFNAKGARVLERSFSKGTHSVSRDLEPGLYYFKILGPKGTRGRKMVVR